MVLILVKEGGIGNSLTFELTGNEITFTSPVTIPYNRFGVTQSWQDGNDGSILNTTNFNQSSSQFISGSYLGPRKFPKDNQSEFYDGIFSGSMIIVATQSLNPGCDPYLNANDTPVVYKPLFFGLATTTNTGFEAVVQEGDFNDQSNVPPPGYAWIASSRTNVPLNGIQQVQAIKLNAVDASGVEVINYLDDFDNLRVLFPDAILPYGANATEYIITGRTIYADHIILQVSQTEGNNIYQAIQEGAGTTIYYPITSSDSGGSMNWSLRAKTDWVTSLTDSESLDTVQQGVFLNSTVPTQEQNVFYYNNFDSATDDALGFFNPGSQTFTTKRIIEQNQPLKGAYTIPYTPNIPWHIEASFKYSASLNTDVQGIITDTGIYHKGTEYSGLATLVDQNFALRATSTRGFYVAAESAGYASALLAAGAPDLTSADPIAYYSSTSFFYSTFLEELFSDELLTTNFNALTVGKYYKFSNLVETSLGVQDYFVVYISLSPSGGRNGALQSGNRQPSSPPKTATTSVINITNPSNFFRPAPREVSGLGQVLYNGNNWNTQLPGNSGSGTNMGIYGGHPKIKVATTNSMEWSFAKLKLAGTPPTLGGGGASAFVPFTGSAVPNNVTNSSFDLDFSDIATFTPTFLNQTALIVTGVPNMGQTYDGSIFIRWSGQNSVARSLWDAGTALAQFNNIDFTLSCTVQSFDNGSEVNKSFNVQLCEERWYPSGEGGPGFSSPRVISVLDTVAADPTGLAEWNGELIQFSGLYGYLLNGTGLPSGGQPADNYSSRLFFQIKNNETEDFEYEFTLEDFAVRIYYDETGGGGGVNLAYPVNGPVTFATGDFNSPTDGFQDGDTNVVEGVATTDYYAQCVVNAYLKRTGSDSSGDYDYIITSSVWPNGGYSGSIYSGSTIQFTDNFPVLVSEDTDLSATTMSTYANPGDMYYIEYEFKDFKNAQIGGSQIIQQQVAFISSTSGEVEDLIEITSTGSGGSAPTYNINNSSVILRRADSLSSTVIFPGTEVLSLPWDTTSLTETSVGSATVLGTYNGNFSANEIYRLSMEVDKAGYLGSGLVITEFSASIFPGASAWSPTTDPRAYNNFRQAQDVDFIVPTYYAGVLPFNLALDCQPLLNNFILQRQSNFIMDVDYNNQSGSIIPVNQEQILENIAVKAAVPDSNYTALSSINPRYNGVKSTSAQLNVWNVGDTGTYGKNPTVELRDAYFGYFNDISDPYPNINSLTQVNISYLIDEQGNALPPSLNDQLSVDTFRQVFPNTTVGRLAIKDGKNRYTPLSTPSAISRIMEYVTPICYSQNSGNNYSPSIPLSGSGYISRYDNDDENDIDFAQFSVAGTASIDTTAQLQRVSYYLDTAESNTSPAGATSPYSVTSLTGSASYPQGTWGGSNGDALNNQQIVSVQHSIVTTYVSETNGVRDELDLTFKMFTGSNEDTQSPFNLEGIDCKVYTETGQVYLLKDVDNYGWFTYTNLPTTQTIRHRDTNFYLAGFNRWSYTRVPIPGGGIHATVDWEMFETLFDLGLMRERAPRNGSGVQALEWIFKANSGNVDIKVGDQISWKMEGFFKDARGGFQQGYFFPTAYEGAYTPMMIKGMGALDYKLEEANKAAAPFWTFSGSATDLSTDLSIIEMSSSNFNEAYGTGFYQGDLPYEPGFSEYFPGNVEPKTTDFDKIQNPIEFLEGDEIRFGNNESFTYTILDVFAPSENVSGSISSSGTPITSAKVKLKLDRAVDPSINKDFFLVRRTITTPQSLYLDTPFPYGILSSGSISKGIKSTGSFALTSSTAAGSFPSGDGEGLYTASISEVEALSTPGILFPDFPTEYLTESASMIVNDLISKGVIES